MKDGISKRVLVTVLATVLFFNASAQADEGYFCTVPMLSLVAISGLSGVGASCFAIVRCYQLKRGTTPQTQAFLADQTLTTERVEQRRRAFGCGLKGVTLILFSLVPFILYKSVCVWL